MNWGSTCCWRALRRPFALPPGLAVFVCSPAALAKAGTKKDRGYYFDFLEFQKNAEQNMTPSTPSIGHVFARHRRWRYFYGRAAGPLLGVLGVMFCSAFF